MLDYEETNCQICNIVQVQVRMYIYIYIYEYFNFSSVGYQKPV